MAISQVAVSSSGAGTGQPSITLPTNIADDVLYLFVGNKAAGTTFTTPSGWTLLPSSPFGSAGEGKATCYRKVSGGSESNPSITLGGGGQSLPHRWICVSLRGVDTTTPEVDNDWLEVTDYVSNPVMPTSAAGGVTCWSVVFLSMGSDNAHTPSWPSGWTEQDEEHGGSFTNRHYYARNTSPGTSSIGGGTITMTSDRGQSKCLQILVREGGGGGGGGDHPASKRFGGVPHMALPGRGNVWAPVFKSNMLIGPSSPVMRKAA